MSQINLAGSSPMSRSTTASRKLLPPGSKKLIALSFVCAPLLFPALANAQDTSPAEPAPVTVLSFKWSQNRRALELADTSAGPSSPAPAMIPQNKNFAREVRANAPAGVRDPNQDTLDGRSAELDRITAEARAPEKPRTDGFTYRAKIQNNSTKVVARVFWEYQFREKGKPEMLSRRQFVCFAKVKPENTKDLEIFTLNPPSAVVSLKTIAKKSEHAFDEAVIINRVEFEDSSMWQRKDWIYDEVKLTAKPASDSKKLQMCRGL